MSMKRLVVKQYRENVNRAREMLDGLSMPSEGWLRTVRKALDMSGAQLGRRLGVTRAAISKREKDELSGSITIKSMQQMAESMGCKFVYAIVPETEIEEVVLKRARLKAMQQVRNAGVHMALESQLIAEGKLLAEVERLAKEMIDKPSSDLWNDDE
ncbi:transcriptional regulator, XRE family [Paraglaciecola polaris LMG 21857]|uniref:Transcriptional regulator, XRE family n=2 Tax=Paraglaciecola polaris TaxID=222814 RepID=K6ZL58_9ALTE|nr:transcriptional regulator, XRE family [Paraglaciecola polaris LMG 21857]